MRRVAGVPRFRCVSRVLSTTASEGFICGDPLVTCDEESRVLGWNRAAEDLTGTLAAKAIGRPCWEVVDAVDDAGIAVCRPGCRYAHPARPGSAAPCHEALIRGRDGRRRVVVSTIGASIREREVVLHLMRSVPERAGQNGAAGSLPPASSARLTVRQRQVLEFLSQGVPAKTIAYRLGLSEITVRNHIRAILAEFRSHSQLEALATARREGVI